MKHGDFSKLAQNYIHRTGYSRDVLKALYRYAELDPHSAVTADVGAGTGKLTEDLIALNFTGFAIEPNDAMREEGVRAIGNAPFSWLNGKAEETGLPDHSVDWVLMGSSFHWTDSQKALKEFRRILKPNGYFVALWNPRAIESCTFHREIENWIYSELPHLKRVSSGGSQHMKDADAKLLEGGLFKNAIFMEAAYTVEMPKERYLGAWRSVNDIQVQAGEEKFQEFINYISDRLKDKKFIAVPYKTRAWMVQAS